MFSDNKALLEAQGRIKVLEDWNNSLKEEGKELKNIIYRKFGLLSEFRSESTIPHKPIVVSESWRTAKDKLEKAHSTPDKTLEEQKKYWEIKLKQQEEVENKVHVQTS